MTTPHNPEAPEVILAEAIPAAAGAAAAVPVTVRHRGRRPARIRVTIFGLDSRWVPQPLDLGILQPGDSAAIKLSILPERGALGARYPFTIAAEASALDGRTRPVVGVAESVLALDSAERISMAIVPSTPAGTFSKGFRVEITNPSGTERTFALVPDSANGVRASLSAQSVTVPPERTVAVKGRVHVKKPTVFGGHNTHTFTVSAQGTGAPEWAEATMRSTPLVGKGVTAIVGLILVVALWATLAIVFIPKISNAFKPKNDASVSAASTEGAAAGDGTQGTQGTGAQGAGNGTGNGSGNGKGSGNGSGTSGNSGNGAQPAGGYQLSGTVIGSGAEGATVTLAPVSLASAGDDGSLPPVKSGTNPNALRGQSRAFTTAATQDEPVGKIPGPLAAVTPGGFRTTTVLTKEKGEFTFSGISAPGFYLLTVAKAGYQTQRFLINSVTLAAPQPLKVELQPGAGKLSGTVTGPGGGPLGAATIVVTDGTVTLQTSSVSESTHSGTPGTWAMDQVSTPGTYLVTASSPGLGAASTLVTLDASGTATVNLTLHAGQASITGTVSGADSLGNVGGLGGITVTATNDDVTRTATTVTSAAMRGAYVLPNLPTPGTYTLTIAGPGFLAQTRTVTLAAGSGNVVIDATLSRADAVVAGRVTGLDANGKAEGGLAGVGLTLASNDVTMKTMSTSGATAGSFQFTGVAPGSYVLTAVQFGRTAASATVTVAAAATQTVNLVLSADIGAELPATAHIRGQVADSRTGGPLTCDRALKTVSASDCVATVTVTAPKDPADASKGTVTYTAKATAALNFVYTIPDIDDPDHAGLPPGLYTVNISAPGYEDTVTHVQVAEGQTVPAPPASMPALGIISGTVTTRVDKPAKASCVLAVPVGVTVPKTLPTSCTASADGNTCTATGISGAQPCALTSMGGANEGPLGTFQVRGLTHGRYQMVLIAQDPEYVYTVGSVPIVTLELGADGQFNAVLDRLGRINVQVQKINSATGQLEPVSGATLTVAKGSGTATAWPTATDASGRALITKLADDTYTIKATSGTITVSDTATISGLNQSVDLTLVIAEYQGPLVGRITTTGDNNAPVAIANATVTVTGVVGYNGSTERIGYAKVTTDANGCYAIVPKDWVEANGVGKLKSVDCPTALTPTITSNGAGSTSQLVDLSTNQAATLITERLSVAVAATTNTQTYPATAATITDCPTGNADCSTDATVRMIPATIVTATPKAVSGLTLRVAGPSGGFSPAPNASDVHITVVSKPPLAQGVSVSPNGASFGGASSQNVDGVSSTVYSVPLTFSDSQFTSQNLALPGTYKLQVSLDGFATTTADLVCAFASSTCSGLVTLKRLPSISVAIDATVLPLNSMSDWGTATVSQSAGPSLGTVAVVGDSLTAGHLTFSGSATKLASANTSYSFLITVPGYGPMTASASCGAYYSTTSPSCTATATPTALPNFPTASVALDPAVAPGTNTPQLSTASVTATISPNPNSVISISVADQGDGTGDISWTDHRAGVNAGQVTPVDGGYTITYSRSGFVSATATLTCTTTCTQTPATVTLKMLPQPQVEVTLKLPTPATAGTVLDLTNRNVQFRVYKNPGAGQTLVSTAHLTLTSVTVDGTAPATSSTAKGTVVWNDTTQPFAGITAAGTYAVTASLDGYQEKTTNSFTCTEGTVDCAAGAVTLETNPAQSGLAVQKFPWSDTHVQFIVTGESGVALATLTEGAKDVTDPAHPVGTLTWQQGNAPANVVTPGNYQITAVLTGYESTLVDSSGNATLTNPIAFSCTTATNGCILPQIAMVAPTTLKVVATGATDAKISLQRVGGTQSDVATTDGTATFTNLSTNKLDTTSGTDGSYTLDVHAAGYEFADGLSSTSTSSVSCINSGGGTATGLKLIPGGTTTCTVTLTELGSIGGTTWWQQQHLDVGFTSAAKVAQPYVTVTAQKVSGGTTSGHVFTVASAADGSFSLTGTKDDEGLARDTTWRITATATGFTTLTGDVKLNTDDTLTVVTAPAAGALNLTDSNTKLSIEMLATTVRLDLVFKSGGAQVNVPPGKFTLAEAGAPANKWECTVPATGAPTSAPASVCAFTGATGTPSTQKLQYVLLPPGNYLLSMNFAPGSPYTDVANRAVTVEPTGAEQEVPFDLAAQSATLQGALKDSTGAAITSFPAGNATVTLNQWPCPASPAPCVAKKFDNTDATDSTIATSTFTMTNLPEGWFTLKVEAPGYVTVETANFYLTRGFTTPQSVTLVAAAAASAKVAVTLDAGTAADDVLAGATVTMTPTGTQPRATANTATFSGTVAVDGSHKATAAITGTIPSGSYSISLTSTNAATPFPLAAGTVTVADAQNGSLADFSSTPNTLNAAPTTLTVDWSSLSVDCVATPADAAQIQLSLSRTVGGTPNPADPQPTAKVNATAKKAVSDTLYLPPGAYSWTPTLTGLTGWSATATSLTVADPAVTPTTGISVTPTITAATNFSVTLKVDGAGKAGATIVATSATSPASPITLTDNGAGSYSACLPGSSSGIAWTVSANDPSATTPFAGFTDVSVTVTGTTAAPASAQFDGYTLSPSVALASGSPSDATADISIAGTITGSVFTATGKTVTKTSGWSGGSLIVPADTYTLTATPDSASATAGYGTVTGTGVTVDSTHHGPKAISATIPYTAPPPTSYPVSPAVTLTSGTPATTTVFTITIDAKSYKGSFTGSPLTWTAVGTVDLAPGTYTPSAVSADAGTATITGSFTVDAVGGFGTSSLAITSAP